MAMEGTRGMSNLHRIAWFDAQVRAERYPTTRTLAERFEISVRQATRDIEYLRDSLGAPLAYCHVRRGYRYQSSSFALPGIFVTEQQRDDLERLSRYYQQMPDQNGRQLAELFGRLCAAHRTEVAVRSDDIAPMSQPVGPYVVEVDFDLPQVVDLTAVNAVHLHGGRFRLEVKSMTQLLLVLLACPSPFAIRSPTWLRNRLRSTLERTLQSLLS